MALTGIAQHPRTAAIQTIDLANIGIDRVGHQLDKLTNLSYVVLSHNQLAEVPALRASAKRLRGLYLDYNRITSAKLAGIPSGVQHLNLSHNHLTFVPMAAVQRLTRLHTIALTGNPINCSCETLQARAWLTEHQVRMDEVICAAPAAVKGVSWGALSEMDACAAERDENIWNDAENAVMLGDQPQQNAVDVVSNVEDEFERDFIPISRKLAKRAPEVHDDDDNINDSDEGSGGADEVDEVVTQKSASATLSAVPDVADNGSGDDEDVHVLRSALTTTEPPSEDEDNEEDGSGSGLGLLNVSAPIANDSSEIGTDAPSTAATEEETETNFSPRPLGIFVHRDDDESDSDDDDDDSDEHLESVVHAFTDRTQLKGFAADTPNNHQGIDAASGAHPHTVNADEKENAESTYIVLVMLAILLLGLIVFVAIRRKNAARRRTYDARHSDPENGHAKELVDMHRTHPGKPLADKNGGNVSPGAANDAVLPLIAHRDKWDSRIQPANGLSKPDQEELLRAQEPLLRKIEGDRDDAEPQERPEPLPRKSRPSSSGSEAQRPTTTTPTSSERNNNQHVSAEPLAPAADQGDHDEPQAYQPISPKPARYSPVYSHDTGRVKIKLTETPRPRTPMLVTRARSNAGDIVTTQVRPPK